MIAELYHKISSSGSNLSEKLEDELTGNFFGTLRYLSFNKGLKQIFLNGIYSDDNSLIEIINRINEEVWHESIEFWKRSDTSGEIDVFIEFDTAVIGIEVKLYSGLSSEDQLERESDMLVEWGNDKKKILLFIADEFSCKVVYQDKKEKITYKEGVLFGYISWQKVFECLKTLDTKNEYERVIISDLVNLLSLKGFDNFTGFNDVDKDIHKIIIEDLWNFEYKEDDKFTFMINQKVRGDIFYEFG